MRIDVKECARLLLEQDDILILTHAHPDGDTLGCGFALCRALLQKGKFAYVKNEADIPPKYNYLFDDIVPIKFTPRYVVAVDVATEGLLGAIQGKYHIDLCIDHHGTNTDYADRLLLDDEGLSVWMAGEQDKPEASRKYAWHDMHLAYRTPNAIYLYVQQNQAYLLNDSLDAAWSLLQASLPAERLHDMR